MCSVPSVGRGALRVVMISCAPEQDIGVHFSLALLSIRCDEVNCCPMWTKQHRVYELTNQSDGGIVCDDDIIESSAVAAASDL